MSKIGSGASPKEIAISPRDLVKILAKSRDAILRRDLDRHLNRGLATSSQACGLDLVVLVANRSCDLVDLRPPDGAVGFVVDSADSVVVLVEPCATPWKKIW